MLADLRRAIGHVSGGRVLDVATGRGGFVEVLRDGLRDWTEIVGIDTGAAGAAAFEEAFGGDPAIRFVQVDALWPGFAAASFDTVSISSSLHHFADPAAVFDQMRSLLRPGGTLIVSEMYRDRQTETQLTNVRLHHGWAAVDTGEGIVHRETYRRAELVALVGRLGLADLRLTDVRDTDGDPRDPATVAELDAVIDRHLERCAGRRELVARGLRLRRRLHRVGIHGAITLVAVGRHDRPA